MGTRPRAPSGASPRDRPARGFSLVEVVVVLLILSVSAAVAVPAYRSAGAEGPEVRTADELLGVLRTARRLALREGATVEVAIDPANGRWWVLTEGRSTSAQPVREGTFALHGDVRIASSAERARFVFSPTRVLRADPVVVMAAGRSVRVTADPWTGALVAASPALTAASPARADGEVER